MGPALPAIPAKRYFTISEVAQLCDVKPHVLRYWEQEFAQLRPMKRRGNRRYYQHHEVLMIRRIRALLYDEGFTIQGARNRLRELSATSGTQGHMARGEDAAEVQDRSSAVEGGQSGLWPEDVAAANVAAPAVDLLPVKIDEALVRQLRTELQQIRAILVL